MTKSMSKAKYKMKKKQELKNLNEKVESGTRVMTKLQ